MAVTFLIYDQNTTNVHLLVTCVYLVVDKSMSLFCSRLKNGILMNILV